MRAVYVALMLVFSFCGVGQKKAEADVVAVADIICTYDYYLQTDSTNRESLRVIPMRLLIGKGKSVFMEEVKYLRDSIVRTTETKFDIATMKSFYKEHGTAPILTNFMIVKTKPDKIKFYPRIISDWFAIEEPMRQQQWKIEEDTKTIKGYVCKKATCHFAGRDYVAWYTMDIPISDGPYKFNGLPGLIVNIKDSKGEHFFELVGLSKLTNGAKVFLTNREKAKITTEDYLKALKNWSNSGVLALEQRGITLENSYESKIARKMKSLNNFIEKSEK